MEMIFSIRCIRYLAKFLPSIAELRCMQCPRVHQVSTVIVSKHFAGRWSLHIIPGTRPRPGIASSVCRACPRPSRTTPRRESTRCRPYLKRNRKAQEISGNPKKISGNLGKNPFCRLRLTLRIVVEVVEGWARKFRQFAGLGRVYAGPAVEVLWTVGA